MKRRQYLTGIGGILGGASVLGAVSKSSCSESEPWTGKVEDEPLDVADAVIKLSLDGYTKEDLSFRVSRKMYFVSLTVTNQSCANVSELEIVVPEPTEQCHRIVVTLESPDMAVIIAQYLRKDGEWLPVQTTDEK